MRAKSPGSRPFLSLLDASFRLGDRLIFQNTSWTFSHREHWAVVGPNGSGKSWLADALRGRIPLVHGEMKYGFRPPSGLTAEESIGHVAFEDRRSELHDTVVQSRWNSIEEEGALRVGDFLSYEAVMEINPFEVVQRSERARARFLQRQRRALKLLDIGPFLERTLLSLSNGERQRVQWARALCHPLRLLILDEPFTGLDAVTRAHFNELLDRLMHTPLRILFITSRGAEIPDGITHVLEVSRGQVVSTQARKQTIERARVGDSKSRFRIPDPKPVVEDRKSLRRALVVLRNVTVRYGEKIILNGVNWTIHAGQSWALLGPNGSGKSTLLSLILGDNPQAYGNEVVVFNRKRGDGESIWQIKKHIGWVSPELHLHFNGASTCLEVVVSGFLETIGLFESPTARHKVAARRWLKRFGMLTFATTPLFALSLGQQRMVLLARALVKSPRLLILDEPCQGLDEAHRGLFLRTIDRLIRRRLVTVIYVTHVLEEIPRSIGRVLRLGRDRGAISEPSQSVN